MTAVAVVAGVGAAGGSALTFDEEEMGGGVKVLLLLAAFGGVRALLGIVFLALVGDWAVVDSVLFWLKNASLDSNHSLGCSPT